MPGAPPLRPPSLGSRRPHGAALGPGPASCPWVGALRSGAWAAPRGDPFVSLLWWDARSWGAPSCPVQGAAPGLCKAPAAPALGAWLGLGLHRWDLVWGALGHRPCCTELFSLPGNQFEEQCCSAGTQVVLLQETGEGWECCSHGLGVVALPLPVPCARWVQHPSVRVLGPRG